MYVYIYIYFFFFWLFLSGVEIVHFYEVLVFAWGKSFTNQIKKIIKNSRKKMLNQKGNLIEKPVTSISKADGIHRETSLC